MLITPKVQQRLRPAFQAECLVGWKVSQDGTDYAVVPRIQMTMSRILYVIEDAQSEILRFAQNDGGEASFRTLEPALSFGW